MMPGADHRSHKRLNNRAENSHQPTMRKEKCLVKFKSPQGAQKMLVLVGRTRNIFSVSVGRYRNSAEERRCQFNLARDIWDDAAHEILCA